ncbi:MAG: polysaccharide biosynthesis protein [Pyrinomonadaceae bacterium]
MGKRLLITGGTGFLGRRLGKAFREDGYEVMLTGRNLDQNRAAMEFSGCNVLASDVANIESVRDVFAEFLPEIVVHAAASKYVDTAEANPMECVDVNVLGSQNVARVSIAYQVKTVVGVSTDKAAPPVSNTYGLTKALMERVYCAMDAKTETNFVCVRFGNMPWSTGSVFPIWTRMSSNGGVIESTGSNMTRLFTLADEAVKLIRTSIDHISEVRGDVLCRTMKAGLIRDFLDVWTKRKGGSWVPVNPRPGERDYEHLIGEAELPYTSEIVLDGVKHYLITPNRVVEHPIAEIISSINAERFNEEEIWGIIGVPPSDIVI